MVEICDNVQDDDGDGLIDCIDPNCHNDVLCQAKDDGGCRVGAEPASGSSLPLLLLALFVALRRRRRDR